MLGTSGSTPTKSRGMPSVAVTYDGDVYLFDCGEGTQMRMLRYDINISKIKRIFISHTHGDHVIGIVGLVRTMALNNRTEPLYIYVPRGHEKALTNLITFDEALINYRIEVIGIGGGVAYKNDEITVSAFRLNHTIDALGYAFAENEKKRFIKEKCRALGIKGEMFSELQKNGYIKIGTRRVSIDEVTEVRKGKKIVYASDTRPAAATVAAARNADLLIHEATYAESEKSLARGRKHSTAMEAAEVAKKAGVKALLLTHISARYRSVSRLTAEARSVFKNTTVAKDGTNLYV